MKFQETMVTQTYHPVLDDMGIVETHFKLISENLKWSNVGIFIDEEAGRQKSVLTVLIEQELIIAVFRVCLDTPESTLEAINLFVNKEKNNILFRAYQGELFIQEQIQSLLELNRLWDHASAQSMDLNRVEQLELYNKLFYGIREKGRGKGFSTPTKRQVNLDAYGRCMFDGCGVNLRIDEISGESGNYGYLAHNVASAENGPRGIIGVSRKLSDNASNILLLCDKHHRLIDKIASTDYPAHRLTKMREDFCIAANNLLDGLSYEPVPAIAVLWPVQRTVISPPSSLQIAQSLAKKKWRLAATLATPCSDNDSIFRDFTADKIHPLWPKLISDAADKVIACLGISQYRSALFAFGPMPQLIALGAKLGNKQEIIPMLRYRDGNQWIWPSDKPQGIGYSIVGLNNLKPKEKEIILTLSFTNHPPQFDTFTVEKKLKKVEIRANHHTMGNGAIGHPKDGVKFMAHMQRFLHNLKDLYDVKKIHLLPCASNAVCIFFGKAFDIKHPELIVYDFSQKTMIPVLRIINKNKKCKIEIPKIKEE